MCNIFKLPARLFSPNGFSQWDFEDLVQEDLEKGAWRLSWTAHILAGIGFTALVAACVLGGMIATGLTFAAISTLTLPLFVGALAVSTAAFFLAYVAFAGRDAALE